MRTIWYFDYFSDFKVNPNVPFSLFLRHTTYYVVNIFQDDRADDVPSSFYGVSFPWEFAGFFYQREVFLAVISWKGGGRFRDPVEIAFQRR